MHLLDFVEILRNAIPKARSFNLFTAIGCERDEVFLHSRLIAALIDPRCHQYAEESLRSFLRNLNIPLQGEHAFLIRGIQVRNEFRNIDILVTNDAGQALIVENKIDAADQHQQLRRYHASARELGYTDIYVRYLTLDGRDPTQQSLDGLEKELKAPWLENAGYATEIKPWLDELAAIAVKETALRETIFQYQTVLDQLVGKEQEKNYMNELVNTLLVGNNMVLARDISTAYRQALVALQEAFWVDVIAALQQHPAVFEHLLPTSAAEPASRRAAVSKYYEPGKKDKMYYGLGFSVPGFESAEVWLHVERALYFGVICEAGRTSKEYRRSAQILKDAHLHGESNNEWPMWKYIRADQDFSQPDEALLNILCQPQQRLEFANVCANAVADLWNVFARVSATETAE
jgi:hypothetical protein